MPCVLCGAWSKTVFSTRPTTDVATRDAHKLMILGYWVRENVPADATSATIPLCSRHREFLGELTQQVQLERERAAALAAANAGPPPEFAAAEAEIRGRIGNLGKYPCPMGCGVLISNGEVHSCEEAYQGP